MAAIAFASREIGLWSLRMPSSPSRTVMAGPWFGRSKDHLAAPSAASCQVLWPDDLANGIRSAGPPDARYFARPTLFIYGQDQFRRAEAPVSSCVRHQSGRTLSAAPEQVGQFPTRYLTARRTQPFDDLKGHIHLLYFSENPFPLNSERQSLGFLMKALGFPCEAHFQRLCLFEPAAL